MKRVLVAVLDWGLGHATRCIPVIRELQRQGCEVALAGSGESLFLLQREFPKLRVFHLPGYAPRYPRGSHMVSTMIAQLPQFIRTIRAEHRILEQVLTNNSFDLVISDNRYGCWSSQVRSVIITHQSNIMMPQRFGWLQKLVRRETARMLNRFHACWTPDVEGALSLAGDLALADIRLNKHPIGWLSRFRPVKATTKRLHVAAILSGPEPQRTLFEELVTRQLQASGLRYHIVRGLPASQSRDSAGPVTDFLATEDLQSCIESAEVVIARSGYSTVMDLHALGAKAIFVPTPGQTEQEYLAERLKDLKIAYSIPQHLFDLNTALKEISNYSGFTPPAENVLLPAVIRATLNALP